MLSLRILCSQTKKDWKGMEDLDFWVGDEATSRAGEYSEWTSLLDTFHSETNEMIGPSHITYMLDCHVYICICLHKPNL